MYRNGKSRLLSQYNGSKCNAVEACRSSLQLGLSLSQVKNGELLCLQGGVMSAMIIAPENESNQPSDICL